MRTNTSSIDTSNETRHADSDLQNLEARSLLNDDQINITVKEIEAAVSTLKRGCSKGADGLNSEHLIHGGPILTLWLRKIFNAIISLEEIPTCFKEGVIVPVYKGKGKDPLLSSTYRGITDNYVDLPLCGKPNSGIPRAYSYTSA